MLYSPEYNKQKQVKIMNRTAYLLSKIAEEAAEVAQMALKSQQFGLDDCYQDGPSNAERLGEELTDLLTVVGMLTVEGQFDFNVLVSQMCEDKVDKVEHYFDYVNSRTAEAVEEGPRPTVESKNEPATRCTHGGKNKNLLLALDTHRAKCDLCGDVVYRSEAARAYYEDGKTSPMLGLNKYPPADYLGV